MYQRELDSFRAELRSLGVDLDADTRAVATAAQAWAGRNTPALATYNRRLAVLSSFYSFYVFVRKRGLLQLENPIGMVERRPVQGYAHAEALQLGDVRLQLATIDVPRLKGCATIRY